MSDYTDTQFITQGEARPKIKHAEMTKFCEHVTPANTRVNHSV